MAANPVGVRRTKKFTAYFEVPTGTAYGRIPTARYIRKYLDLKEHEGWRVEHVGPVKRDPIINVTRSGGMDVYVFDVWLSRPTKKFTFDVPDKVVPQLLATGHFRLA